MGKPEDYADYPHSTLLKTGGYQPFSMPEWPKSRLVCELGKHSAKCECRDCEHNRPVADVEKWSNGDMWLAFGAGVFAGLCLAYAILSIGL